MSNCLARAADAIILLIMMTVAAMTRADLEVAILEQDDLMGLTEKQIGAMTTEELRAHVQAWVEAGDECAH